MVEFSQDFVVNLVDEFIGFNCNLNLSGFHRLRDIHVKGANWFTLVAVTELYYKS